MLKVFLPNVEVSTPVNTEESFQYIFSRVERVIVGPPDRSKNRAVVLWGERSTSSTGKVLGSGNSKGTLLSKEPKQGEHLILEIDRKKWISPQPIQRIESIKNWL